MTHCNRPSLPQQRRVAKQAQKIDANHFFNLLTGPQLLEAVEAQLPEHRERHYPPTLTLAMFLGQVMSADGSCQNTVNEALVNRLLSGMVGGQRQHRRLLHRAPALAAGDGEHAGPTNRGVAWHVHAHGMVVGRAARETGGWHDGIDAGHRGESGALSPTGGTSPWRGLSAGAAGRGDFPVQRRAARCRHGAYQGKGTGEHGLFRGLKASFVEGDIMLADGYYCSYFLIADLQAARGGRAVRAAWRAPYGFSPGRATRRTGSFGAVVPAGPAGVDEPGGIPQLSEADHGARSEHRQESAGDHAGGPQIFMQPSA